MKAQMLLIWFFLFKSDICYKVSMTYKLVPA